MYITLDGHQYILLCASQCTTNSKNSVNVCNISVITVLQQMNRKRSLLVLCTCSLSPPITRSTWIHTLDSCCDVSTSPWDSWPFSTSKRWDYKLRSTCNGVFMYCIVKREDYISRFQKGQKAALLGQNLIENSASPTPQKEWYTSTGCGCN